MLRTDKSYAKTVSHATLKTNGVILSLALAIGLTACGAQAAVVPPRIAAIRQAGKLVVATAITRPFEYFDERTNQLVGFDVDLAQMIAQRIGVPVEWKVMGFADLLPALQGGQVDMVIAAMYITPERLQIVDMSQPYLNTGLVVVVRANETTINGLIDLPGKIVGVKEGATGARYAARLKEEGIPIAVRRYLETADSLEELERGYVDAVFNDRLNTVEYLKTHPNIKIVGEVFDPAGLGIAVRKDDTDLLALINAISRSAQASGELDRLYARWIGK